MIATKQCSKCGETKPLDDFQREQMRWLFLRGTQWQIGTFDVAMNLSNPWPGEGQERGVMADAPWLAG